MFPTINPRQSFPALEQEMLAYWKANNTFKKSLEIREDAPEFNFYDGPPFATGTPHYGHLLAGTIKDVIPRYQTMQGKFVERRFGWDCHGLPIENIVEKKLGISGKKDIEEKIGVYEFNEECRRNVFTYVDDWRYTVERMGRWVDMDNDYKTMDASYMESVWWVFKNIYDKGYVYESYRVVPYCTRCSTSLSNFEVNQGYEDRQDKAVTVKFKVKWTASKYILAWTTTPWTLPANLGLAVGTDLQYTEILDKTTGDTYVLATDRIATYYKNPEDYTLVREYPGSCLVGMEYEPIIQDMKSEDVLEYLMATGTTWKGVSRGEVDWVIEDVILNSPAAKQKQPYGSMEELADDLMNNSTLFPREAWFQPWDNMYKVVPGHHVTTDSGTGVVHIAPAYGVDDAEIGRKEKLGFFSHIDDIGHTEHLLENNDVYVFDYNQIVIDRLKSEKKLVHVGTIDHSYPHCWRCGTPLIYRAISAWYVHVESMKDRMIANNEKVNWIPETIKHGRFGKWLEGARDWNISRNRYWGAAIPVWKSEDGDIIVIGSIKELYEANREFGDIIEHEGKYTFKDGRDIDLHKHFVDNIQLSKDGKAYTRIPEVLDCWFESGSMPYASKHYPFDFLSHGKTFDAIEQAVTYEEKEQCLRFFKTIWIDDLKKKYDMDAFFDSDIFFIREKWEIVSVAEVFKIDKESSVYGWRYDYESLKRIQNKNSVYISRLGTSKDYRNKWYATNLLEFIFDKYASEWLNFLYLATAKEDLNASYYEKLGFTKDLEEFQMGKYTFSNFEKKLSMKSAGGNFRFPADFIAEGLDQTRGWFYTLLILGTALFDNTPFMNVIVNGLILAEDGKKMSKSLKNYPDPNDIIDKYGADALRFFMLSSQVVKAEDLRFSEAGVEETVKKVLLPLWNTYSFFTTYANIDGWSPSGTMVDYVRHGQTELNIPKAGVVYEQLTVSWGLNDHELTDEGVLQCKRLGEELCKKGTVYDVIVTTGMKRTDNTARIIAEEIGFNGEWVTEEGLRERMVDEKHEGVLWSEIAREYKEHFPNKPFQEKGMYMLAEMGVAESNDDFEARTVAAYQGILDKHAGKRVLIVGHGNTFRSVYGYAMGTDRTEALTNKMYRLQNAELVHFPAVPLSNPLDRFIISEVQMLIAKTVNAFEGYDLQQATRAIVDFMDDLTNWYIRRSRRRFWKSENDGDKMGAYETLYSVLVTLTKVMAPITPMIAEAVYRGLTGRESVHLEYFPEFARTAVSPKLQADMKRAREIITLGLALRGQKKIRVRQPLASITIGEPIDAYFQEIIREELNVKEVKIEDMSAVARKICKPNAKLIGPRFGKAVQDIIREAKSGNFQELDGGRIQVGEYTLESGEYEIAYEPLSGVSLDVMSGSGMVIAMDTLITEELETEGYARDIVRVIQDLRKEAGYEVSDRIRVALRGEKTDSILSLFSEYITSETLSAIDNSLTEGDISREVDMEGVKVSVLVKR